MDSPFAPPLPPVEPPYRTSPEPVYANSTSAVGGTVATARAPLAGWPVQPGGLPSATNPPSPPPASSSVVMETAVLPKRNRHRGVLIAVAACVVSAGVAFAIARVSSDDKSNSAASSTSLVPAVNTSASAGAVPIGNPTSGLDVIAIVAKIRPSVVKVAVDIDGGISGSGEGVGTGVILTADGEILTNAHVVADASKVRVVLDGQTEPIDAKVLGFDVGNDLALIKIDKTGLSVMSVADSDNVRVGQPVVAMGYALDLEGDVSVTSGIISALNRSMVTDNGALDGLLQTDAAISSGNSGGPLVDAAGEMIGINTAVARGDEINTANNIAFAISTKEINRILDRLRSAGSTDQPAQGYLGIGVEDRHDGGSGAIVSEVQPDSPADKLGLKVGDVVTHVNGVAINGQAGLIAAIRDSAPGDEITVDYSRDGKAESGKTTLAARPGG
jgi:S1-C subfamily serine protease